MSRVSRSCIQQFYENSQREEEKLAVKSRNNEMKKQPNISSKLALSRTRDKHG